MIISLTGFMGCGKSSVGRRLSELLCCHFMDLDDVIVEREGRSIPDIFATDGEAAFRAIEVQTLKKIVSDLTMYSRGPLPLRGPLPIRGGAKMPLPYNSQTDNNGSSTLVLALGGGTVMTPECAELVRENTVCIYLRASVDTLVEHLASEAAGRPMLSGDLRSRIETLMLQRSSTYEKTAHIIIDTDGMSIESVASEIASVLNRLTSL